MLSITEKKRSRFRLAWSRPCTDQGQTVYSVHAQISAKFHPGRSTCGSMAAEKPVFDSNRGRSSLSGWAWPTKCCRCRCLSPPAV